VVSGFSLIDDDHDTGLVVVHVRTSAGGVVTLNADHIGGLDFNDNYLCPAATAWTVRTSILFCLTS
jgi:hypothetical protein